MVTSCGRLCLYRKKINLSTCLAGQAVGIKEVDDGSRLVSFMEYDLGYIDPEEKTLPRSGPAPVVGVEPVEPVGVEPLCVRCGHWKDWLRGKDLNLRPLGYEGATGL